MSDIVGRLRNVFPIGWEGEMRHEAADEIERLRAEVSDILAENDALRFALNNTSLHVAAARREGIEAAWGVVADEPVPEGKLTFHEVMQRDERMMAAIRALLEDK